jgi:GntR family transcriptional repressor for pyruvate dehydrogenase complex
VLTPVRRKKLPDNLAERIQAYIIERDFKPGDRLPSTAELAARFEVGHPTLREGLKKLETIGIISVKHGSGIYVGENVNRIFLINPVLQEKEPTRKILLDLIEAREPIELQSVGLAAERITGEELQALRSLLDSAKEHLEEDEILSQVNMGFHKAIASASGNTVLWQVLEALTSLFREEQRALIHIYASRLKDYEQHEQIFEALKNKNKELAVARMRSHLASVRQAILKWNPRRDRQ